MKMLAWNCQGLGGSLAVTHLEEVCKNHSPDIIFLSETKNQIPFIRKVCKRIKFQDFCTVDPIGLSGGLALFWQQGYTIELDRHFCNLERRITNDMNQMLMAPITEGEIKKAVFSMKTHSAPGPDGTGAAIFDKNYNLIEVWGRSFSYLDSALRAEAEAVRWTLLHAKYKGWNKMLIKSDSQVLVHMVYGIIFPSPDVFAIIKDIQKLLNSFAYGQLVYFSRNSNIISHHVAKFASKLVNPAFWSGFFPAWIVSLKLEEEVVRSL